MVAIVIFLFTIQTNCFIMTTYKREQMFLIKERKVSKMTKIEELQKEIDEMIAFFQQEENKPMPAIDDEDEPF